MNMEAADYHRYPGPKNADAPILPAIYPPDAHMKKKCTTCAATTLKPMWYCTTDKRHWRCFAHCHSCGCNFET